MEERTSDNENIEEEEEWLQKNDISNKIFLRAVEREMVEKCADDSINTKRLTIFLRNIYAKEARLHPLLTQSLSLFGNFVLPKAIFIPPSQIVMLVAEYDADITFEELLRRFAKSGEVKKQERKILYADNLLLGTTIQKRAVHMSSILLELGRNIVSSSLNTVGEKTDLPQLECHLCHFKTESRIILETHKEIPHYIRRRYRCSFCTEFSANFLEIKNHFLEKHDILARSDYWSTTLECPSCAVMCNSEFSLRKHKKFCYFVKTGFTMFSTRKQALCAINEDFWDAKRNYDSLHRNFEQDFMCAV